MQAPDAPALPIDFLSQALTLRHIRQALSGLSEEAPEAYKDVDLVVETVEMAGLARRVARLIPRAVIKG